MTLEEKEPLQEQEFPFSQKIFIRNIEGGWLINDDIILSVQSPFGKGLIIPRLIVHTLEKYQALKVTNLVTTESVPSGTNYKISRYSINLKDKPQTHSLLLSEKYKITNLKTLHDLNCDTVTDRGMSINIQSTSPVNYEYIGKQKDFSFHLAHLRGDWLN